MITHMYKYPVKGMSGAALQRVELTVEDGLKGDRAIAIARKPGTFDRNNPEALPKSRFLMLMRDERLALLDTKYDEETGRLSIRQDGATRLEASLDDGADVQRVERFFADYLHDDRLDPEIIRTSDHKFTDISVVSEEKARAISLINLNSVRALAESLGVPVHHMRFRANVYFEGVPAWQEFDWIEQDIKIGSCVVRGVLRTRRCAATQVNPETGERDINIPAELKARFGHLDMGIYAEVTQAGAIEIGDQLQVLSAD